MRIRHCDRLAWLNTVPKTVYVNSHVVTQRQILYVDVSRVFQCSRGMEREDIVWHNEVHL
jgi:hypothetical protein